MQSSLPLPLMSHLKTNVNSKMVPPWLRLKCSPAVEKNLQAVEGVLPVFQVEGELTASVICEQIEMYSQIYPVFVLRAQETTLTSKLTAVATQRLIKSVSPAARQLAQRILFAVVQILFFKAEDIRLRSASIAPSDPDTAISEVPLKQISLK